MKQVFFGFVVAVSAFGQEATSLPDFAKFVVPVVVQINGRPVISTGIQVGPELVVVPRLLLLSPASLQQDILVGTKPARHMTGLLNNVMALLTVPGLRPDAPVLRVIQRGLKDETPVFFVGYNVRGEATIQNASIGLEGGRVRLDIPPGDLGKLGLGWGLFEADGDILAVISNLVRAPDPEGVFSSHIELQPARPMMAAVASVLGVVTEKF